VTYPTTAAACPSSYLHVCVFVLFDPRSSGSRKDSKGAIARTHFTAEGEVSFKSVLYVPEVAPKAMYDTHGKKVDHIKVD